MSKKNKKLDKVNTSNKNCSKLGVQTTNKTNSCDVKCDYNER